MATSSDVTDVRVPLRLRMVEDSPPGGLHGRWWPQSRDLGVELADLVDHFPSDRGRVMRAVFSPPDWDAPMRRVPIQRGFIKAGSFPRDDTHVMLLLMFDRTTLKIMVVPPGASPEDGAAALRSGSPEDVVPTASAEATGVAVMDGPADDPTQREDRSAG